MQDSPRTDPPAEPYTQRTARRDVSPWLLGAAASLALLVLLFAVVAVVLWRSSPATTRTALQEQTMPDGTILALEQVTFGQDHQMKINVQARGLAALVPGSRTRRLQEATPHNALVLWFSRRDAETGQALDFDWWSHSIAYDEHGCSIRDRQPGRDAHYAGGARGESGSRPFSALPAKQYDRIIAHSVLRPIRHRGESFQLAVFDKAGNEVARFDVPDPNPRPDPPTDWEPEPIPITKCNGDLSVTLTELSATAYEYPVPGAGRRDLQVRPRLRLQYRGAPSDQWTTRNVKFTDAFGYTASPSSFDLCFQETAWKLEVGCVRKATARFDPNELWTVPQVVVPREGTAVQLNRTETLDGVTIRLIGLGGPGTVIHKDLARDRNASFSSGGSVGIGNDTWAFNLDTDGRGGSSTTTVTCDAPHVVARITGLTEQHHLPLLRARNADGAALAVSEPREQAGLYFWFIQPPPSAGPIELTFIVQKGRTFEFFIKPPEVQPARSGP